MRVLLLTKGGDEICNEDIESIVYFSVNTAIIKAHKHYTFSEFGNMDETTHPSNTISVTIVAYPGMTMLDAIGPNDVLANSPYFRVQWVSTSKIDITNDHANLQLTGLTYYADIDSTDILLIPGGPGDLGLMADTDFLSWIIKIDQSTRLTTSVCTGSLLLAKAGLLHKHRVCTHWACRNEIQQLGAVPVRKRFVQSGKYITASGVSAGIDMALYIVECLVSKSHARDIRFGIEYFPNQLNLVSSNTLPETIIKRLRQRFHKVFGRARAQYLD